MEANRKIYFMHTLLLVSVLVRVNPRKQKQPGLCIKRFASGNWVYRCGAGQSNPTAKGQIIRKGRLEFSSMS